MTGYFHCFFKLMLIELKLIISILNTEWIEKRFCRYEGDKVWGGHTRRRRRKKPYINKKPPPGRGSLDKMPPKLIEKFLFNQWNDLICETCIYFINRDIFWIILKLFQLQKWREIMADFLKLGLINPGSRLVPSGINYVQWTFFNSRDRLTYGPAHSAACRDIKQNVNSYNADITLCNNWLSGGYLSLSAVQSQKAVTAYLKTFWLYEVLVINRHFLKQNPTTEGVFFFTCTFYSMFAYYIISLSV